MNGRGMLGTALLALSMMPTAHAGAALELVSTIALAGVKGRIDHLSADVVGHRIFVAALGNDTVEVLDADGRRRSITGLGEPQGVLYLPGSDRLFIANGEADRVDIVDARSLSVVKRIEGLPDADNVRDAPMLRKVIVGYGHGALALLDAATFAVTGTIALPGHPESFRLERDGRRAFVNVPSAHAVVVADLEKRVVTAQWHTGGASANFPMALDEAGHRLFVGTRSPAMLLVYDTVSGHIVAKHVIGGDADDLFFDARRKRVYVICGEGRVDVLRQETPDRYALEESVATAPRARTGLFVAEESMLYIAAPAAGTSAARIMVYRVK